MGMSGTCAGIYKYGVGIIWGSSYELPSASEIIRINTEDGEKYVIYWKSYNLIQRL